MRLAAPPAGRRDAPAHQVLRVQHADHVVDAIRDTRAAARMGSGRRSRRPRRAAYRCRSPHLPARHHQLLRLSQVQPQRALQPPCSSGSSSPPSRLSAISSSISSGEWMCRCACVGAPMSRSSEQAAAVQPGDEGAIQPQRRQHRQKRVQGRLASGTGAPATSEPARRRSPGPRSARAAPRRRTSTAPPSSGGRRGRDDQGASHTAIVACAYAPSTRLESVMPIWHAAMYRSSDAGLTRCAAAATPRAGCRHRPAAACGCAAR